MESTVNFSVFKEKIIKTNDLLQLHLEKSKELDRIRKCYLHLKTKYEQSRDEVDKLKLRNETLQSNIRQYGILKEEHKVLKLEFEKLQTESGETINNLQINYQSTNQELKECKEKLKEQSKNSVETTIKQKSPKLKKIKEVPDKNIILAQKNKQLMVENKKLVAENSTHQLEIYELKKRVKADSEIINSYNITELEAELKQKTQDLMNLKGDFNKSLESRYNEINRVKNQLNESEQIRERLTEEKEKLIEENISLKNELSKQSHYKDEIGSSKKLANDLVQENKKLNQEIIELKEKIRCWNLTPTNEQISEIMTDVRFPVCLSPLAISEEHQETEENNYLPEIDYETRHKILQKKKLAKFKRRRMFERKQRNVDFLEALITLKRAKINFTISSDEVLPSKTMLFNKKKFPLPIKMGHTFIKQLNCTLECCQNSQMLLKGNREDKCTLLGFFNVKHEKKESCPKLGKIPSHNETHEIQFEQPENNINESRSKRRCSSKNRCLKNSNKMHQRSDLETSKYNQSVNVDGGAEKLLVREISEETENDSIPNFLTQVNKEINIQSKSEEVTIRTISQQNRLKILNKFQQGAYLEASMQNQSDIENYDDETEKVPLKKSSNARDNELAGQKICTHQSDSHINIKNKILQGNRNCAKRKNCSSKTGLFNILNKLRKSRSLGGPNVTRTLIDLKNTKDEVITEEIEVKRQTNKRKLSPSRKQSNILMELEKKSKIHIIERQSKLQNPLPFANNNIHEENSIENQLKVRSPTTPKNKYKRPICSIRRSPRFICPSILPSQINNEISDCDQKSLHEEEILECPQSPTSTNEPVIPPKPKKIPLEKNEADSKMAVSKIEILFNKLVNYTMEEEALNDIIQQFLNEDATFIAEAVLDKISLDCYDCADAKYPPAPVMTPTQRTMLGFMSLLEKNNMIGVFDSFLKIAEHKLLTCEKLEELIPITRLYLAICKLHNNIDRMRKLCCDVFYFCGNFAIPFLFTVLTSWTEVLPHEVNSKEMPLARVLVQIIYMKDCNEPGYQLMPLKNLLVRFYGYPWERWDSHELFKELYHKFLAKPVRSSDFAIILFCKHHTEKWVHEMIEKYLKPLIDQVPTDNAKATVIILIGNLYSRFSSKSEPNYLTGVRGWLKSLITATTPDVIRSSVYVCLNRLKNK